MIFNITCKCGHIYKDEPENKCPKCNKNNWKSLSTNTQETKSYGTDILKGSGFARKTNYVRNSQMEAMGELHKEANKLGIPTE
jgi:predicted  nucleic acid-binding Zn-ribbon protein